MMRPDGRRFAQGAELVDGGVSFRVFAPEHRHVQVVFRKDGRTVPLAPEEDGYWSAVVDSARPGDLYSYRLGGVGPDVPDIAAHFMPEGPHGPAEIVDHRSFPWTDSAWTGRDVSQHVIYELHIGTFSPEGTWAGAEAKLPFLRELGITTIEVMPVAEFAGDYGWGYDGVAWFAPTRLYGKPDDFRRFVDRAHALGLGVLLDVVYNHFGANGNYTSKYAGCYTSDVDTEWGAALNYDGKDNHAMRSLACDNAAYWIEHFHLDGLRLDATQAITDRSREHMVTSICRAARDAAKGRRIFLVGENEPQDARLLRNHHEPGVGSSLDALWNDDFHHTVVVALTGRRQAYYSDYHGVAHEWIATAKHGFLYQGQRSEWQGNPRGHPTHDLPLCSFVSFMENHDQVANSLWGTRLWQQCSPGQFRAMTALMLLGPWTPMLFQGQEWSSSAPFHYFASNEGELAELVRRGRAAFLSQFPGCRLHPELLCDPADLQTFETCRLRWAERSLPFHARALRLHQDLLRLRFDDPTVSMCGRASVRLEVATVTPTCAFIRYFVDPTGKDSDAQDRLLVVNLGADIDLVPTVEPLLAPPAPEHDACWTIAWSSEDPAYGGHGTAEPDSQSEGWRIPGAAALLLAPSRYPKNPVPRKPHDKAKKEGSS